jgi:hypothetical protein
MEKTLSTAFPMPPDFYHLYTDENCKVLKEYQDHGSELPAGFPYLEPPMPIQGTFTAFGMEDSVEAKIPTLQQLQIPSLDFDDEDLGFLILTRAKGTFKVAEPFIVD